ncbi:MAG: hypothetical protein V7L14_29595 [Nostoc sp.]|uniref:TRAFAC clade GTPase domain-containing protein n=1 Tax=Nostoc sp. TaxID=1180 RepID=UPI002FFD0406
MTQEINIAMLGAKGVGKTSLLTAIYEQFDDTIGQTNLQLTPDLESSALLQEKLGTLRSLLDDFEAQGGFESTENEKNFIFDLGKKGAKPSVRLKFTDFPGVYFNSQATANQLKFIDDLLQKASVVLITIDTPALMERNSKWHEEFNRPHQVADLFKRVYTDIKSPKLVIFVPVRCESYLKDANSANILLKNVKEKYSQLLELLSSAPLLPWVVSVVTPVQTVGNVVFSSVKEIEGQPHFYFHKTSHDAKYSPKDSDQPLRYILRFMLKLQIEDKNRNWGPFSSIRIWLGWDNYLKQAAMQTALSCKTTEGFTVIQGDKWLNID